MKNALSVVLLALSLSGAASANCLQEGDATLCSGPESVSQNPPVADCLKAGDSVTLTGTLVRGTFSADLDRERVETGEHAQGYWFLKVSQPIGCVEQADTGWADWDSKFQLLLSGDDYSNYRPLLGRQVVVTGKIMLAVSAGHKTAIVIEKERLLPEKEVLIKRKVILH